MLQYRAVTRRSGPTKWVQQAGLLTSIPFVLLVGPAIGYYAGTAIDRHWSFQPWGMATGLILGLGASARVTIDLIRQANQLNQSDSDDE